jgi:hypothetical protein
MAMIIYFAGFATALYTLAPATDRPESAKKSDGISWAGSKQAQERSQQFAEVAGDRLRKFVSFAEEKAVHAGNILKEKIAEKHRNDRK